MDLETITARRQQIESDSPCDGCGSSLASCQSRRGKDPTAPSWFGCCARGLDLAVPCHHVPDSRALLGLLKEIESGEVTPVDDLTAHRLLDSITEYPLFEAGRRGR